MPIPIERREWVLKVALVELGLWIARAAGGVTQPESRRILEQLKEWGASREEIRALRQVGEQRLAVTKPPDEVLRGLGELFTEEQGPIFLELLAETAFRGEQRDSVKVGRLLDIGRALGLSQDDALRIIEQVLDAVGATSDAPALFAEGMDLALALRELGLSSVDASAARKAYRRLTLRFHPDRHPDASERERELLVRRLMRVRAAYDEVLARAPVAA